jgi:hypothetical protein
MTRIHLDPGFRIMYGRAASFWELLFQVMRTLTGNMQNKRRSNIVKLFWCVRKLGCIGVGQHAAASTVRAGALRRLDLPPLPHPPCAPRASTPPLLQGCAPALLQAHAHGIQGPNLC